MRKWLIAAGAAAVVAVAGVLTFVLWPDPPPSDDECRDLFVESISGGEFPAECQEWFDAGIAQIEEQTDVINACQDRVVEVHARTWTRSEERRVGKRVELGSRRTVKEKNILSEQHVWN